MTQQERIEQAATIANEEFQRDASLLVPQKEHFKEGFLQGYEHALSHQWISVDEESPAENRILAKLSPSFCGREDYLEILHRIPIEMVDLKHPLGYYDSCGENVPTKAITHWMLIPETGGEE